MKIFLSAIVLVILLTAGCIGKRELYKTTDGFVQSLETVYESYGLSGINLSTTTSDGIYTVTPMFRLIVVRIERTASLQEYEKLKKKLERRYKNNSTVDRVYICNGGTVVIDCRN